MSSNESWASLQSPHILGVLCRQTQASLWIWEVEIPFREEAQGPQAPGTQLQTWSQVMISGQPPRSRHPAKLNHRERSEVNCQAGLRRILNTGHFQEGGSSFPSVTDDGAASGPFPLLLGINQRCLLLPSNGIVSETLAKELAKIWWLKKKLRLQIFSEYRI